MKLLLVIVSIIAVATVDRTDFPDGREDLDSAAGEPEDHNSAETEHEQKETTLPIQDSIIENDAHHFYSNQTGHIIPRAGNSYRASGHLHSRGSRCKAKDVCIVMGGFCVTNAKLCGGRLVPEGCKGSKCQCCVPGTLETMIHNLEQKLQTMQANLTNANLKLNMEFQSMRENLTDANSKLNMEFQSTRDNLTKANSELNMEFQSMQENLTDSISEMMSKLDSLMSITTTVMTCTNEDPTTQSPVPTTVMTTTNEDPTTQSPVTTTVMTSTNEDPTTQSPVTTTVMTTTNEDPTTHSPVTTTVMTTTNEDPTTQSPVTTTVMTTTNEDPTTQSPGYPVGFFFTTAGSSQRYKFYNDTPRSWTEAKEKCQNEGLMLPEPDNPISLTKYLVETYGIDVLVHHKMHAYVHLGARGTGSNFRWERSGRNISNSDRLWYTGEPRRKFSNSDCLLMLSGTYEFSRQPYKPYYAASCSTKRFTLCEFTTTVMTTTTEDPTTQSPVTTTVMTTTTEDPTTQSPVTTTVMPTTNEVSTSLIVMIDGCPEGFFNTTGSSQCYRFYKDTRRSWTEAKEMCQTEGYVLAVPANAISLRKYLVETYGQQTEAYAYLGARGTGSNFSWERSGRNISNSDSLWYTSHPGSSVLTSYCLLMLSSKSHLSNNPTQPYYARGCTNKHFTVCEYV